MVRREAIELFLNINIHSINLLKISSIGSTHPVGRLETVKIEGNAELFKVAREEFCVEVSDEQLKVVRIVDDLRKLLSQSLSNVEALGFKK